MSISPEPLCPYSSINSSYNCCAVISPCTLISKIISFCQCCDGMIGVAVVSYLRPANKRVGNELTYGYGVTSVPDWHCPCDGLPLPLDMINACLCNYATLWIELLPHQRVRSAHLLRKASERHPVSSVRSTPQRRPARPTQSHAAPSQQLAPKAPD